LTFGFEQAAKDLKESGYTTVMALVNGKWEETGL
jgi:hypothetical protein